MSENTIRLKVTNFAPIKEADIIIDGITVLAGENGCGKSSLSKLLLFALETSRKYDSLLYRKLHQSLSPIRELLYEFRRILTELEQLHSRLDNGKGSKISKDLAEYIKQEPYFIYTERPTAIGFVETFYDLYTRLSESIEALTGSKRHHQLSAETTRLIPKIFDREDSYKAHESKAAFSDLYEMRTPLLHRLGNIFDKYETSKEQKDYKSFTEGLADYFNDRILPEDFEVRENGIPCIRHKKKTFYPLSLITKTVYIESPFQLTDVNIRHWSNMLHEYASQPDSHTHGEPISILLRKHILGGNVIYRKIDKYPYHAFTLRRQDKSEVDMQDCGAGTKAFGMLQLLFHKGFLTKDTLLIIDEPEAHLHPQLIVEYARLMVLLNKQLGVRFLVSSHHMQMVSAIRYISEGEGIQDRLNYYVAKKTVENNLYIYEHLGNDITKILQSLNLSLDDMIRKYGVKKI